MKSKLLGTRKNPRTDLRDRTRLIINLTPVDDDLRIRLRLLEQNQGNISFLFSRYPEHKTDISLYLLPVHKLKWLHTTGLFNYKPVIVYGPPHNLYRSFIAGCSDYLKDPWDEHELVARAERLLDGVAMEYPWGVVTLRSGTLTGPRGAVALQPYQVTILKTLCRFRGSKVNREVLAHLIWGENRPASRAIDMHMANLRRKMKTVLPEQVRTVILTCRPGGYMLR